MEPSLSQCAGAIARSLHRVHEPQSRGRVARVERDETLPPSYGGLQIADGCFHSRELRERCGVVLAKSAPLFVDPPLEVDGFLQEETVKEWTRIKLDRALAITGSECLLECDHVAFQRRCGQAQGIADRQESLVADGLAQHMHRLLEQVPRIAGVAVGPEVCDQLVACNRMRVGGREQGQ